MLTIDFKSEESIDIILKDVTGRLLQAFPKCKNHRRSKLQCEEHKKVLIAIFRFGADPGKHKLAFGETTQLNVYKDRLVDWDKLSSSLDDCLHGISYVEV